jgi:hypothetical protein
MEEQPKDHLTCGLLWSCQCGTLFCKTHQTELYLEHMECCGEAVKSFADAFIQI